MRPPATLNLMIIWYISVVTVVECKGQLLMLLHGVWLHLKGQIHLSDFKVIWNAVYKCFYKLLSCWKSIASNPPQGKQLGILSVRLLLLTTMNSWPRDEHSVGWSARLGVSSPVDDVPSWRSDVDRVQDGPQHLAKWSRYRTSDLLF